jgi:hypothetical protein
MATLDELQKRRIVERLTMSRVAPQVRQLWAFAEVKDWLHNVLPTLKSFYADEQSTPIQQAYALFSAFIRGQELFEEEDFWRMRPIERDVYELKSPDLRFFGWFVEPKLFLIAAADTFENTHMHKLHEGYRGKVEYMRDELDLNEPKVVAGAEPRHVF